MNNNKDNKCDVFKMVDDYIKEKDHKDALEIIDEYMAKQERIIETEKRMARMIKRDIRREITREVISVIFHYGIPVGALIMLLISIFNL